MPITEVPGRERYGQAIGGGQSHHELDVEAVGD
jgi:hypothetical protein